MNSTDYSLVEYLYNRVNELEDKMMELRERLAYTTIERDEYFRQCKSYEMWQNRAIQRVKDMQR